MLVERLASVKQQKENIHRNGRIREFRKVMETRTKGSGHPGTKSSDNLMKGRAHKRGCEPLRLAAVRCSPRGVCAKSGKPKSAIRQR